jgi:predicted adenine nucleotide alpha hydrolase (AANH) superfamily ATPase
MKILLHTCCAPCLIYPAKKLKKDGMSVSGFFYNPNIFPEEEYQRRRMALAELSAGNDAAEVIYPEYDPGQFSQAIKENTEKPGRCSACFSLRLEKTAQFAKENGFDSFSTTLLVSPYQNQEVIKKIGEEISRQLNIAFHFENFRPGFAQAHKEAKIKGIYCQKYCGCSYSMKTSP